MSCHVLSGEQCAVELQPGLEDAATNSPHHLEAVSTLSTDLLRGLSLDLDYSLI